MKRLVASLLVLLAAQPLLAVEVRLVPGAGALAAAVAAASPGDALILPPGLYSGPAVIDRPLTLRGTPDAVIDGGGQGSVLTLTAPDVTIEGLTIRHSGGNNQEIDSGVRILKGADRARILGNVLTDNLHGIDIHGGRDALVSANRIVGRQNPHMIDRGNGIYVWNSPGAVVEKNDIRFGRDGIFANTSKKDIFRGNLFRDLRFAIHYMYTHDSEVSGNISIGNHLGFAIMYSNRVTAHDNLSLVDRSHGLMLNSANDGEFYGNLVRGGAEKCTFIYDANKNLIYGNRFDGCAIGIHFTAGSARNVLTGNSFVGNRNQVKYVGTRDIEWSFNGRGNYWSDNAAFDLNGDGLADSPYRPNDLMDHILWSQPAAALLTGAPAVQLIRWSQSNFPATLPGGVVDSHPLMAPIEIAVPPAIAAMEAEVAGRWQKEQGNDTDTDALEGH
ncbi:MAG: nitrous oxide reductase family maturation protein NosD [Proteobacteria bacterium]|nr:nitrous oxide reductase family maturation protein NosD [Pseudomonadota bacterium]MBS0573486.1 nitrous oxide reductase family maturation protein NosD [Pseudomonadota bacterium]